jgi:hypothetical protein
VLLEMVFLICKIASYTLSTALLVKCVHTDSQPGVRAGLCHLIHAPRGHTIDSVTLSKGRHA